MMPYPSRATESAEVTGEGILPGSPSAKHLSSVRWKRSESRGPSRAERDADRGRLHLRQAADNTTHSLGTNCMPGAVLSIPQLLRHLIFTETPRYT